MAERDPQHRNQLSRRGLIGLAAGLAVAACSHAARRAGAAAGTAPTLTPGAPAGAAATPTPHGRGNAGESTVVRHGTSGRPEVALTFHGSGDPALAVRLLEEAERGGAAVTVLAVGIWLRDHPSMARRILSGHHDLGNHTYTHPTLSALSPHGIAEEVDRCARVLHNLIGGPGSFFRPSGGPRVTEPMRRAAAAAGYPVLLGYDVDPSDNEDPGADAVTRRVLAGTRPGSIVSLHLGHAGTVTALPRILDGLAGQGLRAVTASALLAPA